MVRFTGLLVGEGVAARGLAGETLNATAFLSGVGAGAYTKVTITYKSTLNAKEKVISYMYAIEGFTPGLGSLEEIRGEFDSYGLSKEGATIPLF